MTSERNDRSASPQVRQYYAERREIERCLRERQARDEKKVAR